MKVEKKEILGTEVEISLPKEYQDLFDLCFLELERIEKTYSRFDHNSFLFFLNSNLGKWHKVSDEFIYLLKKAEEFRQNTNGFFDITVKEYLDEFGYGKKSTQENFFLKYFRKFLTPIKINKNEVLLNRQIDFGGLGKGFAIDRLVSILEKQKVPHYCINAGGDIYAKKGNGFKPWTIYLEHPDKPDFAIGKLELHKNAIAASSSNKRFWKNQKGVFHHIINPKTKKPSSGLKEVFVLAKKAIDADAYATAFFAAGFFQAIALSFVLPVEVLLISDQNKIYKSKNFCVELF